MGCHITVKELVPIVMAAAIWGADWQGRTIMARCDNTADWGSSRDKEVMHLVRCLAFIKAKHQFEVVVTHVRGVAGGWCDATKKIVLHSAVQ
jgi:hypothetical protein